MAIPLDADFSDAALGGRIGIPVLHDWLLVAAPLGLLFVFLTLCVLGPNRKVDLSEEVIITGADGKPQEKPESRRAHGRRLAIRTYIGFMVAQGVITALTVPAREATGPILFVAGVALLWGAVTILHPLRSDLTLWVFALATAAFEAALVAVEYVRRDGHYARSGFAVAKLVAELARLAVLVYLVVDSSFGLRDGREPAPVEAGAATDAEAAPLLASVDAAGDATAGTSTAVASSSSSTTAGASPNYGGTKTDGGDANKDANDGDATKKDGDNAAAAAADADKKKGDEDEDKEDPVVARLKKRREERLKAAGGWLNYLKDFSVFFPIIDPRQEPTVILCLLGVGLCIFATRFLVVLAPRQIGLVTDRLLAGEAPYKELGVWLILTWVSSYSGIGLIQSMLKLPVHFFTNRMLTNAAFRQVMSLSMDFHSDRDSGEIIRAIEQGRSITNVIEWMVTDIAPAVVDLGVAMVLLHAKFNIYVPLVMVMSSLTFFWLEMWTTERNRANRRATTKLDREATRRMHQAVENWPTVAYFNMFGHEGERYAEAIEERQQASRRWWVRDAINDAVVQGVVPLTFFVLACLAINEIAHGRSSTGDFVFLVQYWDYLVWPLRSLSWQAKYLMQDLTDAERLLELFQTKATVADKPGAVALPRAKGHIKFTDVDFCYDPRKTALSGINLEAHPGQTIAFVGPTGAGKSSIIKLLHRFYDVTSGSITIDGHDIRDVKLGSLRDSLGVVPQDPMLFNVSIMENLRYAKPDATDEEVHAACRAAAIHDKIMTFADKYETRVGANGVKLSGGEAQRVVIARAFLKNPPILILDEATSAVDTDTEARIQEALEVLKRERTTFLIAHRLSTVMESDVIMVIDEGNIIERGSHDELVKIEGGRYRHMWDIHVNGSQKKKKDGSDETIEDLMQFDKDDKKDTDGKGKGKE
jgi:ABC-type transport system involved in Fe-S cluster assembly fused permease/ATPase subunit